MAVYQWSGKTPRGIIESGEITASTKDEVIAILGRKNIIPTLITEKPKKKLFAFGGKIKDKDIVVFTRQFATMINAGLPLVQALDILSNQVENKAFGRIIAQVRTDVESGLTYADSLKKHPKVFSELYANMVAAGEAGGILDTILNRLATYIEKAMKLKKKVKGAMVYPAVITTVAVVVIIIIMVFVVPTFSKMFAQLGGTLPLPTRMVIGLSKFIAGTGGLICLISAIAAVVFLIQFRRTEKGKSLIDLILLKLPIFGTLLNKVAVAKFTRTLGTLVSSGVPILEGLEITAKTSGNAVVEEAIMKTRKAVEEGKTIVEPLQATVLFPGMVTQMIGVGESTGALDAMLSKVADFYEDEVDEAIANLMSLLEPLIIVFLGTTVGGIVIAMYMPLFSLIQQIQ